MEVYAGLDLHSTNTYVAMIDGENKVLYKQRHRNEVPAILSALDPFKKDIQGVVVESTYNWYWLVDGLMDAGYRVHLANVSAIKQYEGLDQVDGQKELPLARQSPEVGTSSPRATSTRKRAANQAPSPEEASVRPTEDIPGLKCQEHPGKEPWVRMKTYDIKKLKASQIKGTLS